MASVHVCNTKENLRETIIALGQQLIDCADNVADDFDSSRLSGITIYSSISPNEIPVLQIEKNYLPLNLLRSE